MAEQLLQQSGPVLDALMGFIEELRRNIHGSVHEQYKQHISSLEHRIRTMYEENQILQQKIAEKEKKHENLKEQKVVTMTSRASHEGSVHCAPRLSANYGELIPGAISHEDVQKQFNSFFSKHRRNYGSQLIKQPDRRGYSIPCIILKIAYELCKEQLLRHLTATILQQQLTKDFQDIVEKLNKSAIERHPDKVSLMDSRLITMKEIEDVFTEPYNRRCAPDHYWEEKKIAFFMLLNCSEIENEKDKMLHDIESQIARRLSQSESLEKDMISEGVSMAFSMVTLVPPAIVCLPTRYNEEWVEPRIHYWDDETLQSKISVYFRPALFLSSTGVLGSKGEVGNKQLEKDVRHSDRSQPLQQLATYKSSRTACSTRQGENVPSSYSNAVPQVYTIPPLED